jgi:3-phosphoshikimate 1-carboxyvinyltransferase
MRLALLNPTFDTSIHLSSSKSESNRALMIDAYAEGNIQISNLSDADDTVLLNKLLFEIQSVDNQKNVVELDCNNAGTVYRFLLTFLANKPGKWILTGSERMKQRPVDDLVATLIQLGADIQYTDQIGYPPLLVSGKKLEGGFARVSLEKSSQFASSLVMAAPVLTNGLRLELTGNPSSMPYLDMTLNMMLLSGAELVRHDNIVIVKPVPYKKTDITVSADWSGASFWFELVALSEQGRLNLEGLSLKSDQGDKVLVDFYKMLGVTCKDNQNGLTVWKTGEVSDKVQFNLRDFPDLLPSLAVTCAGLGVEAVFTGLENLVIKESNRTLAIQQELAKVGISCSIPSTGELIIHCSKLNATTTGGCTIFRTYDDHRMAMALAPLVLLLGEIEIQQPEVVSKSYPAYWNELLKTNAVSID